MNRIPARFAITLTFLGSFTGTVNVQTRLPPVPGAHVVTITPPGQVGSEPAIAVNPNDVGLHRVGIGGRRNLAEEDRHSLNHLQRQTVKVRYTDRTAVEFDAIFAVANLDRSRGYDDVAVVDVCDRQEREDSEETEELLLWRSVVLR